MDRIRHPGCEYSLIQQAVKPRESLNTLNTCLIHLRVIFVDSSQEPWDIGAEETRYCTYSGDYLCQTWQNAAFFWHFRMSRPHPLPHPALISLICGIASGGEGEFWNLESRRLASFYLLTLFFLPPPPTLQLLSPNFGIPPSSYVNQVYFNKMLQNLFTSIIASKNWVSVCEITLHKHFSNSCAVPVEQNGTFLQIFS